MVKEEPGVKKHVKKEPGVSAFKTDGGEDAKKLAKSTWDAKKKAMKKVPAKWPKDVAIDDECWCSWLPKDWKTGLKMTENGFLLRCYVGPAPDYKRFFHKKDIESHLGRNLASGKDGERGDMPKELHIARVEQRAEKNVETCLGKADFSPNDFLKYTGQSGLQYMNDRCHKAHGLTVKEVLSMKYTDGAGKQTGSVERTYGMPDLRYDLKAGRLELVKTRREVGKVPAKPTGLAATASGKRPMDSDADEATTAMPTAKKQRGGEARKDVKKESAASASSRTAIALKQRGVDVKKEVKKESPTASPASAGRAVAGNKVDALAWEIYDGIRKQAAKQIVSGRDVFALVGIARTVGIDDLLVDVLPKILAKPPKERGDFGELTIKQFDAAMTAKRKK